MSSRLARNEPAVAESVRPLRAAARSFAADAGACEATADDVSLAVSEAVTNAVLHAYPAEREPGPIELAASVADDGQLEVEVCDHGCGMSPRTDSPGAGVGLRVIAAVAGAMRINPSRDGDGTCVTMRFAL